MEETPTTGKRVEETPTTGERVEERRPQERGWRRGDHRKEGGGEETKEERVEERRPKNRGWSRGDQRRVEGRSRGAWRLEGGWGGDPSH